MASLNKVLLIGRLGKDPEILNFENGTKKMSVTIATTETYHGSKGNLVQNTEWHNLVSFGDIEIIKLYDGSYVLFIEVGAMSGNFEHLCFYIVENAPISIINKLKKYI